MSSKWLPWDFLNAHPNFVKGDQQYGVYAFHIFDPIVEKILFNKVYNSVLKDTRCQVKLGQELSVEWLEGELFTLDLFQENKPILILHSEKLNAKVRSFLIERSISDLQRFVFFSFSSSSKFFDEWKKLKREEYYFYEVTPPRFWEGLQLLDFLLDAPGLTLDYSLKQYLLEHTEHRPTELMAVLNLISHHHRDKTKVVKLENVKDLIASSKYDQFKCAKFFSQKKIQLFFQDILTWADNRELLRSFSIFMQGHILKMIDPSYVQRKSRPSKYDKEILSGHELWKRDELERSLRFFSDLERDLKSGIVSLEKLRQVYLKVFK